MGGGKEKTRKKEGCEGGIERRILEELKRERINAYMMKVLTWFIVCPEIEGNKIIFYPAIKTLINKKNQRFWEPLGNTRTYKTCNRFFYRFLPVNCCRVNRTNRHRRRVCVPRRPRTASLPNVYRLHTRSTSKSKVHLR